MLTEYLEAAVRGANDEILADDRTFGEDITGFGGVYTPYHYWKDAGQELLSRILRQARISRDTWEKL